MFIDPVGTGFSRLVEPDDRLRDRYLSIDGDAEALADVVVRWLTANDRLAAPKYLVGESYGGFRAPLAAEKLQTELGVALSGLILLSPVLDFGWWLQPEHNPLPTASLLPSLAATAMDVEGSFDIQRLRSAEAYAAGPYIADFLLGLGDEAAVARMVERVAELTGLERSIVARADGRVDNELFAREIFRNEDRSASIYDGTVAGIDPTPSSPGRGPADPVLDALTAPLTSAMLAHYRETLDWLPDRRYLLLNQGVNGAWDWSSGRGQPEVVSELRRILALDPTFNVLVVHGYTDLLTPYFASELILRQLPRNYSGSDAHSDLSRRSHVLFARRLPAARFATTSGHSTNPGLASRYTREVPSRCASTAIAERSRPSGSWPFPPRFRWRLLVRSVRGQRAPAAPGRCHRC